MPLIEDKPAFRRRLGYYLWGIAIGFVLLGMLQLARRSEAERAAQQQQRPTSP